MSDRITKANVKNIYPLTPLQEGILFHALYDGGASYFEQLSYRVRGKLDLELFRLAWEELVRRHDALRTVFAHRDVPRPLQIVLKKWHIEFGVTDAGGLTAEQAEALIVTLREEDRARPFDLSRDPLTRVRAVALPEEETEVIWSHHHIILDGWSVGILQGELLEIYGALLEVRRHTLPEPPPFAEYVAWIGKRNEDGESQRFWRDYLEGFSQATGIPRFASRAGTGSGRGRRSLVLDRERTRSLSALAADHGFTLNLLLQALWGILLCRCNGVEEAVFAATVSGRPEELSGVESMVGLFINAVPVRVRLSGSDTLPELLASLQRDTLAATRHHWRPLAEIQSETPLKQGLLDHIVIFENYPVDQRLAGEGGGVAGFAVVRAEMRENTHYPFELSILPGETLEFSLGYDRSLYGDDQMERLCWWLEQLAQDALSGGAPIPLSRLTLLSPRERELTLTRFNAPPGEAPRETVADLLERQAAATPERTALLFGELRWSYREMNQAANRVAHLLGERFSVRPDDVVGILMDRSERMMAALLGVIKSGAAYLPLDPAFPAARIAYMLSDSGCRVLLSESGQRPLLATLNSEAAAVELDLLPEGPTENPRHVCRPEHLIYLIYTSGSTGLPKGVMLEHRNIVSFNRNLSAVYGLAPGDTILALTTITFDISVLELICPLMSGMTVRLAPDALANDPARAAELLGESGVDVLQITPSRLKLMLEEKGVEALSGLKALLVGGEPLPEHLLERLKTLRNTSLFNVYGPTETAIWSTSARLNDAPLTVGTPLCDEEVLILDRDGTLSPVGVWGEICIGGAGVSRGYWNRAELTAERFGPHPARTEGRIYRTGDLGRFLPDGSIQCGGRLDNQVKVRGYRIETGEIEQHLLRIPGVREAVAHAVEMDGVNELAAYLVPSGEVPLPSPAELRRELSASLPEYMLPSRFVALDRLPLTPNGKTDRKALPVPATDGAAARSGATGQVPPRTETEAQLAGIWQRVLGVERVGADDNFFDLGGHSIKAIRIASAIAKELGREVPLALIFAHPVLSALARALEGSGAAPKPLEPLPAASCYQTSPGQRRLWVLQRMAPESPAYNMPVALGMEGAVDVALMERSLAALVRRHEALRTVYEEREGMPVQVILPDLENFFRARDLRGGAHPCREALQLARSEAATPFIMEGSPLFRACFYRTGERQGLLLLLLHHINGDGWSWGVLLRELAGLCRLAGQGKEAPLPPLPVQYKEWASRQNRDLAAGEWEGMRRYWLGKLAGVGAAPSLPADFPRPATRSYRGGSLSLPIPAGTVRRLEEIGRARGATLFTVLLALVKTLLYRMSGDDDVTVGTAVAGRPSQELEEMVGFFVNTIALRDRVDPEEPFDSFLERVGRTALEGYRHQLYPFDLLVRELAPPRETGRAPLFDVMAVLQDKVEGLPPFADLAVAPVPLDIGAGRFDLTFDFVPEADALVLELEYALDLFLPETAARIAARLLSLAQSAAAAPQTPLRRLELLPERERHELLPFCAGPLRPYPEGKSMVDLFREQAAGRPEAIAVLACDGSLNYGELDRLSDLCALRLQTRYAVAPEEPVGVMTGRNSQLLVALLGAMKSGGVYLPIDPDQPEARLRHIVADSGLRILLVDAGTAPGAAALADLARTVGVEELLDGAEKGAPAGAPGAASGAYAIYTSGSTGLPKGVLLRHGGFVNMILDQIDRFGVTREDRCLLFSSFAFDGAMSEIFLALHSGAAVVVARREEAADPALFARLLREKGATVATLPPVYLSALRSSGTPLYPLRVLVTAGEAAIAADTLHYARCGIKVFNAYGPTEASVCAAIHPVDPQRPRRVIPIGTPMANSELLLLDEELQPVPFGVTGEICLGGPGLARGYLGNEELTMRSFVPHPFRPGSRLYRTGDLARRLCDGTLEFEGRKDHQVKVRGFRVECGEVERALLAEPGVDGAVVLARGEGAGRELVAYLLLRQEGDAATVRRGIAARLPSYMIPARVVPLDSFPLNRNGKVDRKLLAELALEPAPAAENAQAPATVTEKALAEIWEEILGRGGISRRDSFFEVGGQSIAAIRVAAAVGQKLGLKLPLASVFQHATLEALALECDRLSRFAAGFEEDIHLQLAAGDGPRIFAFPPLNGYPVAYRGLAGHLAGASFHAFTFIESADRLERYCATIEKLQPSGALVLLGYSCGGNLAFEAAKELERRGRRVSDLLLLDSWKRLPGAPVTEDPVAWAEDYAPDPALFGELAELMLSPHVREAAFGKLRQYLAYTESVVTEGAIEGKIHLLRAPDADRLEGLSQQWQHHARSGCVVHAGSGAHLDMLKEPWVARNADVVRGVLAATDAPSTAKGAQPPSPRPITAVGGEGGGGEHSLGQTT